MNKFYLVTELDNTVIVEGTEEQVRFALKALTTYGIRSDKFMVISDLCKKHSDPNCPHCN